MILVPDMHLPRTDVRREFFFSWARPISMCMCVRVPPRISHPPTVDRNADSVVQGAGRTWKSFCDKREYESWEDHQGERIHANPGPGYLPGPKKRGDPGFTTVTMAGQH